MKISVYIATSLDGFIARRNGAIDWLTAIESFEDSEDYGYKEFSDSVDCMIMGRHSMETVIGFPQWPYEEKRVIVLSNTLKQAPPQLVDKIELYSGSLTELVASLRDKGCKHLYIDGGKTIQSFIDAGLITDFTITKIPVLIGEGLPLFGELKHDINLKHIATKSYPNGLVQSTYEVA